MRIAIIEKEEKIDPANFDKVVSFCTDNYLNVDNYIDTNEFCSGNEELFSTFKLYEEVYFKLHIWLRKHNEGKTFVYRDVDILQAYGKAAFDFLITVCKKAYIVKKIIEKDSPSEIWITGDCKKEDLRYPFLSMFIADLLPSNVSLRYFTNNELNKTRTFINPSEQKRCLKHLLIKFFETARNFLNLHHLRADTEHILIYSDLNKIPTLFKYLKGQKIIFLRKRLPLRYIFYFLRNNITLAIFPDFSIPEDIQSSIYKISDNWPDVLRASNEPLSINGFDVNPYLKRFMLSVWRNQLKETLEKTAQLHILFSRGKIKSLLLDEDRGVYKNLTAQVARIYNCKSYVNCHGEPFNKSGILPLSADKILVWGKDHEETLTKWGLDATKIFIVGCSKYDKYLKIKPSLLKTKICKDLKLNPNKPVMLIGNPPILKRRNVCESSIWQLHRKLILDAYNSNNKIQIIIKLHPGDEYEQYYYNLKEEFNLTRIKILKDYDPLILAKGVDILIICASTFVIDGLAYQKPVIIGDATTMDKYKKLDVFYDGTTTDSLKDAVNGVINGIYKKHITNWRSSVGYCLNGPDGSQTPKRIADLLVNRGIS